MLSSTAAGLGTGPGAGLAAGLGADWSGIYGSLRQGGDHNDRPNSRKQKKKFFHSLAILQRADGKRSRAEKNRAIVIDRMPRFIQFLDMGAIQKLPLPIKGNARKKFIGRIFPRRT